MQVNANLGMHTLALFGAHARGIDQQAGSPERVRAPVSISPTSSFKLAHLTEMQGVYSNPRTTGSAQVTGVAQRTIDALRSVRDTEMKLIERSLQGEVEAALGRQLSDGESIYRLSDEDEMSLSDDVRWSTHELRIADINMRVAMGEGEPVWSLRRVTDDSRGASAEELVDAVIASQVDTQLGAIQRAKEFAREGVLMDLAHADTGGFSEDVRNALATSSKEEVGAMRDELIAARKAQIASGEHSVTVEAEKFEVVPTGYGQSGTRISSAMPSFHVLRFA